MTQIYYLSTLFSLKSHFNFLHKFSPETEMTFRLLAYPVLYQRMNYTERDFVGLAPKLTREDEDYIALCSVGNYV